MKIITLNAHSIPGNEGMKNAKIIADAISELSPDAVCLQEVNQSYSGGGLPFTLREDNFGLLIKKLLHQSGIYYEYIWHGFKVAYGKYEEGLAILSKSHIFSKEVFYISKSCDIMNYKTRMALGIKCGDASFYSVHTGRPDDTEEPFENQWKALTSRLENRKNLWLCGDFNCPPSAKEYHRIIEDGWNDSYEIAREKDHGNTVSDDIDGWKDNKGKMRIDYIFTKEKTEIKKCETLFNGINYPVVSDHFGVAVEI